MKKSVHPYLIRMGVAVWFVGMVVFAVWGVPVYGEGNQTKYLPLIVRQPPVVSGPPLHSYLMVGSVWIENDSELFSVRADGSDLQMLTDNEIWDHEALLSPDGDHILVEQSSQEEDSSRLVLMNRDGSNPRTLMEVPFYSIYHKAWSPDGRWISVVLSDGNPEYRPLIVIATDTTIPVELAPYVHYEKPVWSPDSRYLTYIVEDYARDYTPQLWVAPMNGTAPYALTSEPMRVAKAEWSPLSDAILYTDADGLTRRVVLDGSENRPVVSPPYQFERVLSGGQRLLAYDDTGNLVVVSLADNTISPLTTAPSGISSYSLSPHERYLVFKGTYDDFITLQPLDGGAVTTISCRSNTCYVNSAAWTWTDDETKFLLNFGDSVGYVNLNSMTRSIQAIPIWERPPQQYSFLPFSPQYATAFRPYYGYPPPEESEPAIYSIDTDTLATTPIVPFDDVDPTVWHYLP